MVHGGALKNPLGGCRYKNLFLRYLAFKYESLLQALQMIHPGSFMWTTDFKSGYHQLPMHPSTFPYLGVRLGGQLFVMTYLPFGVAPACRIYTQVMAAVYR